MATGLIEWYSSTGGWIRSAPAVDSAGTIYVGSQDSYLYALNPDGGVKWSYATPGEVSASPAIADDGTVYIGSDNGSLYAIGP